MLLDTSYYDVKNSQESHKFSFSSSPVIFKILSDSLYSNKIGSIVRELASNAKDAHIAAGYPEKTFKIDLPVKSTKLFDTVTPLFRITDYGIGLSEEDIYNIYTVYGESNKRHNNDMIGGFGIGSKSPFSYTETFTIISVHGGKKTVYCAYIDEKGFPAISKMSQIDTDEHPGISVSFNVKKEDIFEFHKEVVNQLKFFDPKPELNLNINFNEPSKIFEGSDWFISSDRYYSNEHCVRLLINGIPYIIETKDFPVERNFTSSAIYASIPIGAIDLNASRESIAYTEKTKIYLRALMKRIENEIFKRVLFVNKDKSLYERSYFCSSHNIYIPKNDTRFTSCFYVDKYDLDEICIKNFIKIYKSVGYTFRKFNSEFHSHYDSISKRLKYSFQTNHKFYIVSDKVPNNYINERGLVPNGAILVKCSPTVDLSEFKKIFNDPAMEVLDTSNYVPVKKSERVNCTHNIRVYNRYNSFAQISDIHYYTTHNKTIDEIADILKKPNTIVFYMVNYNLLYHPSLDKKSKHTTELENKTFYLLINALKSLSKTNSKVSDIVIITKAIAKNLKDKGLWEFPSYKEWSSNILSLINVNNKFDSHIDDICLIAKINDNEIMSSFFNSFYKIINTGSVANCESINIESNDNELIRISGLYNKWHEFNEMNFIKVMYEKKISDIDISHILDKINSEPLFMYLGELRYTYLNTNQCKYMYNAFKKHSII